MLCEAKVYVPTVSTGKVTTVVSPYYNTITECHRGALMLQTEFAEKEIPCLSSNTLKLFKTVLHLQRYSSNIPGKENTAAKIEGR